MLNYSKIQKYSELDNNSAAEIDKLAADNQVYKANNSDYLIYAKTNDFLVAFIIWREIIPEIELLSVAVDINYRRQQIASNLVKIADKYWQSKAEKVFLEVRESNKIAQNLYLKFKFQILARRENYYPVDRNKKEAALIMCREYSEIKE